LLALSLFAIAYAGPVLAQDCSGHQEDYEAGVNDGRLDGSRGASENPTRHRDRSNKHKNRQACYEQGYQTGYSNAAADANRNHASGNRDHGAPTEGSNEREYYDDGCHEGKRDAKNGMSMAYERHSDMYDSRFEPYFAQGYEACWRQYR
jgi:hypothetical protein